MKKQPKTTKSSKLVTESFLEERLDERFEKFEEKMDSKLENLAEVLLDHLAKMKDELFAKIDRIAGRIDDHDANDIIRDNDIDELGMRVKRLEHVKN